MADKKKMKPYSTGHLIGVLVKEGVKGMVKSGMVGQAADQLKASKRKKREYDAGVR
jgi:hypothetical protein